MDSDKNQKIFQLCLAIYRVTNFFPPGEVLIEQLRKSANEILADYAGFTKEEFNDKIDSICRCLGIAKAQNWLKPVNFEILIKEYNSLKLSEPLFDSLLGKKGKGDIDLKHNQRQQMILAHLKENKQAKMRDFLTAFNGKFSERTIRNDLQELVNKGEIWRQGDKKSTVYFL